MRPILTLLAVLLSAPPALLHAQPAKLNVLFIELDELNDWVGVFASVTPQGGFPQITAGDELVFERFDMRGKQLYRVVR